MKEQGKMLACKKRKMTVYWEKKKKRQVITRITECKGQQNRMFPIWKNGIQCKSEQPQSQREQLKNEV